MKKGDVSEPLTEITRNALSIGKTETEESRRLKKAVDLEKEKEIMHESNLHQSKRTGLTGEHHKKNTYYYSHRYHPILGD